MSHLDLLTPGEEEVEGHACHPRHLDVVDHYTQLLHELHGQQCILDAVDRQPPPVFVRTILEMWRK